MLRDGGPGLAIAERDGRYKFRWFNGEPLKVISRRWPASAVRREFDLDALVGRIEKEMPRARPEMQYTLMAIGVKRAAHRSRAIAIGEKFGLYAD